MNMQRWLISGAISLGISLGATPGFADTGDGACSGLPSQSALQGALSAAVGPGNGGLGFNMWASIVANDGTRLRRRVYRVRVHRSVAGQPGHFRAEGQYRE
jgi:hypothetical protein